VKGAVEGPARTAGAQTAFGLEETGFAIRDSTLKVAITGLAKAAPTRSFFRNARRAGLTCSKTFSFIVKSPVQLKY
jgi:hypothetical protein